MIQNKCKWDEKPDAALRRCYDCAHLKGAVSWWCTNEEAIKYRGTQIPGVKDCPFWAPAPIEDPPFRIRLLRFWNRIFKKV